jgi:hypothetical protein
MFEFDDTLASELATCLDRLADGCDTAADVAQRLDEAGCRGVPGRCALCPVARWVMKQMGLLAEEVWVSEGGAEAARRADEKRATAPMPPVLAEFITAFDRQQFPQLAIAGLPYA